MPQRKSLYEKLAANADHIINASADESKDGVETFLEDHEQEALLAEIEEETKQNRQRYDRVLRWLQIGLASLYALAALHDVTAPQSRWITSVHPFLTLWHALAIGTALYAEPNYAYQDYRWAYHVALVLYAFPLLLLWIGTSASLLQLASPFGLFVILRYAQWSLHRDADRVLQEAMPALHELKYKYKSV